MTEFLQPEEIRQELLAILERAINVINAADQCEFMEIEDGWSYYDFLQDLEFSLNQADQNDFFGTEGWRDFFFAD